MRPLLLLAPLAWLLLAHAKDDAKLEGEGAVWGAVPGSLAEDPSVQATWGRRAGGGAGLRSSVHLPAGDSDRSLPLMEPRFPRLCSGQERRQPRYTSPFSTPIQSTEEPVIIPIISSKAPVACPGPTASWPHQLSAFATLRVFPYIIPTFELHKLRPQS